MKKLHKILSILFIIIFNYSYAQNTILRNVNNAKSIEINKQEFIGKPLKDLLKNIKLEIKSIIPAPNKNPNEINRLSLFFVSREKYRNSIQEINEKPTRIVILFNQNWDLNGKRCVYDNIECTKLTPKDKIDLGKLIIFDIIVYGNN